MKKKYFLLLTLLMIALFGLTGCGSSWNNVFEMSKFKYDDEHIKGKIKNKTDKFYDTTIIFNAKSNTLTEELYCYIDIKPYETKDLSCIALEIDDSYELEVKDVIYNEEEIPIEHKYNGEEIEISIDELKYYYENIYNSFTTDVIGLTVDSSKNNEYPYIEKVVINSEKTIEIISKTLLYDDFKIFSLFEYDLKNQKVNEVYFLIDHINDERLDKFKKSVILHLFSNMSLVNQSSILQKLSVDTPDGHVYVANDKITYLIKSNEEEKSTTLVIFYE